MYSRDTGGLGAAIALPKVIGLPARVAVARAASASPLAASVLFGKRTAVAAPKSSPFLRPFIQARPQIAPVLKLPATRCGADGTRCGGISRPQITPPVLLAPTPQYGAAPAIPAVTPQDAAPPTGAPAAGPMVAPNVPASFEEADHATVFGGTLSPVMLAVIAGTLLLLTRRK